MRTPISGTLSVTELAMTPYTPMDDKIRARTAKTDRRTRWKRGSATDPEKTSLRVRIDEMACCGLTWWMAERTEAAICRGSPVERTTRLAKYMGDCAFGMKRVGLGAFRSSLCRALPTTPTISTGFSTLQQRVRRAPTGSSPEKKRSAKARFARTTFGRPRTSAAVMSRPATRGVDIVSK